MLRLMIRTSWLVAVVLTAAFAIAQAEFSADVVDTSKGDAAKAKIYFGKDKIRFEPANKDPRSGGGAFIMNLATQTSTVLMEQQHMYMEMPAKTTSQRSGYNFFRTGDVENACADWMAQSWNKGGTCHKVGNETVNGRNTVKYDGTNSNGEAGTIWIDPKLRFPVKWVGKNGTGELRSIQEGSQPSSLFEVPAGYNKLDMSNMGGMQHPQ